jgi:RimJ/RimL family protein N-acetyltransferase
MRASGLLLLVQQHAVQGSYMQRPDEKFTNVLLRDVTAADLPTFFAHQLDPDANQMAAFAARDRDTFMAHWTKILADETIIKQTILVEGQVAGNIVSFEQSGEREVGYWIGKEYWGKGVATQALSAFLGHVKTRPLYAHVAKHNIASIRVLEKCGFTIVGEDKACSNTGGEEVAEFILKLEADESDEVP